MSAPTVSTYLNMDLGDIHYLEQSNEDKDLLILFHPYGKDAKFALKLFSFLKDHFHLIALDLPYHGKTKIHKSHLSSSDISDIINELLARNKNKKYYILGHSFGARLACIACSDAMQTAQKTVFYGPELGTTRYTKIFINAFTYMVFKLPAKLFLSTGLTTFISRIAYKLKLIDSIAYDFMMLQQEAQSRADLISLWKTLALTNKRLQNFKKNPAKLGKAIVFFGSKDRTTPIGYYKKSKWNIPTVELTGGHFSITQHTKNKIKEFLTT